MEEEKKTRNTGRTFFIIILVAIFLIAGVAAIAIVLDGKGKDKERVKAKSADSSVVLEQGEAKEYNAKGSDGVLTSVEIAEKVKPSVMAVITYKGDSKSGEGSGIFMSEDASGTYTYVLTCAHIVRASGLDIKIQLADATQYDAELVGYDTRTDIAVLRVKATGFTLAEFGDSSVLKVGEPVYAIGNPGGTAFFGSFTGGYISAIDRPTTSSSSAYSMECIQHDAAINPGNSGGALVNSFGQVIGMNSSKIADMDYEGMGFAIPVNVIQDVVADLVDTGYVQDRAKLGISYLQLSQNQTYSMIARMNDLPSGSIIIADIDSSSDLGNTNVEKGDIIIAANGKDLTSADVLLDIIEHAKPGDKLALKIAHVTKNYKVETFEVTVELKEDTGSTESITASPDAGDFTNPFAED
ncbi:MAG: S1C family serine protease [Clostridia bacterium]|nr:S1C family serine protease [Clostridia bacterium]